MEEIAEHAPGRVAGRTRRACAAEGASMPSRRAIIATAVAALIAVAIGIVLSYQIHWFPVAATTQAHNTDRLYHVLVIATIPIFVLVVTVILFSAWQFHMRPGEELKDGPPIHGNTRLEVFWTALPACCCSAWSPTRSSCSTTTRRSRPASPKSRSP